jgi:hypothetical protein
MFVWFSTISLAQKMKFSHGKWIPMKLDKLLDVDSRGGHGFIRNYFLRLKEENL